MRRAAGYGLLVLFILTGLFGGWVYYGTFAPGGGRIDPRFVLFFKFVALRDNYEGPPLERRAKINRLMMFAASDPAPVFGVESRDATAPGSAGPVPVRVYDPKTAPGEKRPAMLYMHGGGFFSGNIATHDRICRSLARKSGAVVISVDYRLAPEFPFPSGVDDSYAALAWVRDHAAELKIDPDRIVVAGDSAGGNLAAVMAMKSRDEKGPKIAYQVLIYPVLNMADFDSESIKLYGNGGFFITQNGMREMRSFYVPATVDPRTPYISPLLQADLKGLPPALVLTAEFDPLRSEGESYVDRLRAQGVKARARRFIGMGHGFVSMTGWMGEADEAIDEIAAVLKASL